MSRPIAPAAALLALCAAFPHAGWAQADIPLNLISLGTGAGQYYRLTINVGIAGGAPKQYLFDTGSSPFNAAYNKDWFPTPKSTLATGIGYVYADQKGYLVNKVTEPSLSFYTSSTAKAASYTLPTLAAGYQVNLVTNHLDASGSGTALYKENGVSYYNDPVFATNVAANIPPIEGVLYGTFGASNFVSTDAKTGVALGSVLGQSTATGYVVSANGTGSALAGTAACNPCVILGLSDAVRAQFTSLLPWDPKTGVGPSFPNFGANGSTEFGVSASYTLSDGKKTVAWTGPTLLDAGTQNLNLHTGANVNAFETDSSGTIVNKGDTLTIAGTAAGSSVSTYTATAPDAGLTYKTSVADLGTTRGADGQNNTVGIAFFLANSVLYDLQNQRTGYSPNFVTDVAITGPLTVDASTGPLGLAGIISGAGPVLVDTTGSATLSGTNTYTGATTVRTGGLLALVGPGSIAASSGVTADGTFDVSGSTIPVAIASLAGAGSVSLGAQTLTLTNAAGTFTGSIADAGKAGGLTVLGGTETLAGVNTYTGATTIAPGATLALAGKGSVAASVGVIDNGVLNIGQAISGASIASLDGTGRVNLGSQTLTLTAPAGRFSGVLADGPGAGGGLTVAAGQQTLLGVNTYTGATTVSPGATLALSGAGSVAASARVSDAGVLDISATPGTSLVALTGTGRVNLGGQMLTLTGANGSFAGVLADGGLADGRGGMLVVNGGTQTLAGVNLYSGATGGSPPGRPWR